MRDIPQEEIMKFDLFADSSANIPEELAAKHGIGIIPYPCIVNGEERSAVEKGVPFRESAIKFYAAMRAGADVKTSLVGAETIIQAIEPSLKAGNDVFLVVISSGISGTYQQALKARKSLLSRYPDRKIVVGDSANASMGEGLLALRVADLRDMGESIETCERWFNDNRYKLNSYFTVADLRYLRKGGRISAALAFAGALLNIKPILKADGGQNAKLAFAGRERGRKKALAALLSAFDERAERPEAQTVAITHADCEDEALELAAAIRERGVKDVIVEYYDICTGSHAGPGTIALFFMGKDRRIGFSPAPTPAPAKKRVPAKA